MEISGKTAIVTGAASGIGLSIATALAEAGANVVLADIEKDAVEQAAAELRAGGAQVIGVASPAEQELREMHLTIGPPASTRRVGRPRLTEAR